MAMDRNAPIFAPSANNGITTALGANPAPDNGGIPVFDSFQDWSGGLSGSGGGSSSPTNMGTYLDDSYESEFAPQRFDASAPSEYNFGTSRPNMGLSDQTIDYSGYAMLPNQQQWESPFNVEQDPQQLSYDRINEFIQQRGESALNESGLERKQEDLKKELNFVRDARFDEQADQLEKMAEQLKSRFSWGESQYKRAADLAVAEGANPNIPGFERWNSKGTDQLVQSMMQRDQMQYSDLMAKAAELRSKGEGALNRELRNSAAAEGNLRAEYAPLIPNRAGGAGLDGFQPGVATMDMGGERTSIGPLAGLQGMPPEMQADQNIPTDYTMDPTTGQMAMLPEYRAEMEKQAAEAKGLEWVDAGQILQGGVSGILGLAKKAFGLADAARNLDAMPEGSLKEAIRRGAERAGIIVEGMGANAAGLPSQDQIMEMQQDKEAEAYRATKEKRDTFKDYMEQGEAIQKGADEEEQDQVDAWLKLKGGVEKTKEKQKNESERNLYRRAQLLRTQISRTGEPNKAAKKAELAEVERQLDASYSGEPIEQKPVSGQDVVATGNEAELLKDPVEFESSAQRLVELARSKGISMTIEQARQKLSAGR